MKAVVTSKTGDPSVMHVQEVPVPEVKSGWVLIQVKAFGLNRSELMTRQGDSPDVKFPRILGIECVGVVERDPSGTYAKGQKVMALMGGMGRQFDGAYAEYCLVPSEIVFPFKSDLPWSVLGAVPEMFQTVSGSLKQALEIKSGETLLIRGGTSSIGMLACQLAKTMGLTVIATTRKEAKLNALLQNGADHALIDNGSVSTELKKIYPDGINKVLELVGTRTLKDSLQCIGYKGMVCMTGILAGEWTLSDFEPMGDIPPLGRLTVYMGSAKNISPEALQEFIDDIAQEKIHLNIDKVFSLDQLVKAHEYMESDQGQGKVVVEI